MKVLKPLQNWLDEHRDYLSDLGISTKLVECRPTENPAVYIDIDTDTAVARITVWDSGDVNFESIEVSSGRELVAENHRIKDEAELLHLLEKFVRGL